MSYDHGHPERGEDGALPSWNNVISTANGKIPNEK